MRVWYSQSMKTQCRGEGGSRSRAGGFRIYLLFCLENYIKELTYGWIREKINESIKGNGWNIFDIFSVRTILKHIPNGLDLGMIVLSKSNNWNKFNYIYDTNIEYKNKMYYYII